MSFKEEVEELLYQNADNFEIAKVIRADIKRYFSTLKESQKSGKEFLVAHTKQIDGYIKTLYNVALRQMFKSYQPSKSSIPISLIALGSYGREQLCVYSDIDLMIVYEEVEGYEVQKVIEATLHLIWDAKLKLGHRVHKLDDIIVAAKDDITIKTAMLEGRFIVGSKILWYRTEIQLNHLRQIDQQTFISAKIAEYKERHKKNAFSQVLNIKDGLGSLRDVNTLYWISNILYKNRTLKDLVGILINEEEYRELRICIEWLFKLRVALHLSATRKHDTLSFEYIPQVTEFLGYHERYKSTFKAQMALVAKTIESSLVIYRLCAILLGRLLRGSLNEQPISKAHRIDKGLYLCDATLYTSYLKPSHNIEKILSLSPNSYIEYDESILDAFSRYDFRALNKRSVRALFYQAKIYKLLETLFFTSKIYELFHPLEKIKCLPQFDGYHKYSVDFHSIRVVYHLENISDAFIQELYEQLNADEQALLKVIALLHDSGKGRNQDHSVVGAKIVRQYLSELEFDRALIDVGANLVLYHTLMSKVAQRDDIYSERVILSFISKIETKQMLDMLYILTYADMSGVDKGVYNNFNAKLMKKLYFNALEAIDSTELISETKKRLQAESALRRYEPFKALPRTLQKRILNIESNLFFINSSKDDIISISKEVKSVENYHCELKRNPFRLIIYRKESLNLGFLLGKLAIYDIVSMRIVKLFDDVKYFEVEFLGDYEESEEGYIKNIIANSFDMTKMPRLKKPVIAKEEIEVNCNHSKTYASMRLDVANQKGLLAFISSVFDSFGIDIAFAKIFSTKNKAKDLFLIEKNGNFCVNVDKIIEKLSKEK